MRDLRLHKSTEKTEELNDWFQELKKTRFGLYLARGLQQQVLATATGYIVTAPWQLGSSESYTACILQ